jgi:hypothetical protein
VRNVSSVRNPKRYFGDNFAGSVNISRDSHKAVPLERDRQLADLQQMLAVNNAKLAEARRAQAEMLRKQREHEEREREVKLTVERKVQEILAAVRDKARLEAEDAFKSKVTERRPSSPACSARSRICVARLTQARSNCKAKRSRSSLRSCYADAFRVI